MEWAISGLAVSLDEAAKFICQGIFCETSKTIITLFKNHNYD